jgi:hypothetical protein
MASASYKQWSAKTRQSRYAEYKRARAAGSVNPPGPCEICEQSVGTTHHAEEYGPTFEAYLSALHSLCARCHAMLHLRFRFPGRWEDYKELCRRFGAQSVARSMGSVFCAAEGWSCDFEMVGYPQGDSWWETIGTERYIGELL